MLKLKQFTSMAESYGADLRRWPESLRQEAEALLAASPQARVILSETKKLDGAIKSISAKQDLELWNPREEEAALARLHAGVAAKIASSSGRPRSLWSLRDGDEGAFYQRLAWFGIAASSMVAIVAGLLIGTTYSLPSKSENLLTMLQPDPIQILAD